MPVRLFQPPKLELPDGAAFAVTSLDEMEARPANPIDPAPTAFVWTGYRKVSLTMPVADFDAAYKIIYSGRQQPCVLVLGDDRRAFAFAAQSLSTSYYDVTKPQEMIRGEMDGFLYEKTMDGTPVTDEVTIAYLTEKYKPREYTAEEIAEMERLNAMYDESEGW